MNIQLNSSFKQLKNYIEIQNFKGYDPFDGLNSRLFQSVPLLKNNKWIRLAWLQFFKRSPINFRPLVGIKKDYNPKGLGLFLLGYINLYNRNPEAEHLEKIKFLSEKILLLQSEGYSGACWGYHFDWQARAFFQPKFTPTVVATSFIVEALLSAYDLLKDEKLLQIAVSAKEFILNDLNKSFDKDGDYTLSYSPLDKTQVFNAGLLGAKTLCLIYERTQEKHLLEEARKIVNYTAKNQQKNGAWAYGTLPFHQWVDSFHTGYNLEAIQVYQDISGDKSFENHLKKGLDYYLNNFFTAEGIPKYYNDKIYPVDVHAPAQLIVTLHKMNKLPENEPLAKRVLSWTVKNMQSKNGYFFYQKDRFYTNKIPYIRWTQAWMFYAMSLLSDKFYDKPE